jgi:hypothetical protein
VLLFFLVYLRLRSTSAAATTTMTATFAISKVSFVMLLPVTGAAGGPCVATLQGTPFVWYPQLGEIARYGYVGMLSVGVCIAFAAGASIIIAETANIKAKATKTNLPLYGLRVYSFHLSSPIIILIFS